MIGVTPEARREWRGGWPAVAAGAVGAAATQIHFASIGMFIRPMSASLGWGSSTVTFGIFICAIITVPGSPFAGWLADRFGLSRILLIGMPLFFLAFASLGLLSHDKAGWIAGWLLVATVGVLVKGNLWMLWVAQKFDAARGLAMALIMCGAGVLAIFVPIVTQLCIEAVGWRMTFPALALAMAAVAIPACIWGFRVSPAVAPDASRIAAGAAAPTRAAVAGMPVRAALRSRAFWQIAVISFLIGTGLVSLQVHLVPMFQGEGIAPRTAAFIAGMFGTAALVGRFACGALLDRYSARVLGGISLLLPALACLAFLLLPIRPATGMAIAALFGLGVGAEGDVLGYIVSRFFGVRRFGTIYGFVNAAFALGAGIGPLTMSVLHDRLGSYSLVMMLLFAALMLCAILFVTLGDYPAAAEEPDADAVAGAPAMRVGTSPATAP